MFEDFRESFWKFWEGILAIVFGISSAMIAGILFGIYFLIVFWKEF
jgi:hypothetical protein